ncbi:MAG: hypothetical protein WC553_00660 [Patescibacteria group bacterium]|jgi:hypothetical protein
MKLLAAINVVLEFLGALIVAKQDKEGHFARVRELLTQLKTLDEEALGRLLQRMNYVRVILTQNTLLPTAEAIQRFILSQVIQIIDCDTELFIPDYWEVVEHQKGGKLEWNPEKIQLYLSNAQNDNSDIEGHELCRELKGKRVLNDCVLDWLIAHPEFIPEEWKGKYIFFWGTIYRDSSGYLRVRFLYWDGGRWGRWGRWRWNYRRLDDKLHSNEPAAVLADAA